MTRPVLVCGPCLFICPCRLCRVIALYTFMVDGLPRHLRCCHFFLFVVTPPPLLTRLEAWKRVCLSKIVQPARVQTFASQPRFPRLEDKDSLLYRFRLNNWLCPRDIYPSRSQLRALATAGSRQIRISLTRQSGLLQEGPRLLTVLVTIPSPDPELRPTQPPC